MNNHDISPNVTMLKWNIFDDLKIIKNHDQTDMSTALWGQIAAAAAMTYH